ncbi:hypothetical protein BDV95DRAFT_58908 [Massariosphaeria phaeospora]|uniref:Chromo domain-containing protein n=1 Tax=Massariosphaeria phaeospora TaxID=100035 RepID=A0A7C8I941_9PLEO|nr:hypothetical protein BDV95DRAFT_58908 [Massariosphaeria phaeospora]
MAPKSASGTTKRKRASTTARHTPNKRARKTKKAPPGFEPRSDIKVEEYLPDSDEDPEKSWDIKDILEEGYDLNLVHHYFVKWEDEEYPDSWVQAINANKLAVKYWKEKKKAERNKRESTDANSSVASTALSSFTSTATPTPSRSRRSGLRNTVSVAADATEGHPPDRVSPLVQVRRQSDFDRSEFERFSQLPSSQPNSSPVPDKADTGRARDFRASGIVPDSQSTDGSGTYIQPTQATQTTQETSGSSGAGAEAELDV